MAKSSRNQKRRKSILNAREESPPPAYSQIPRFNQPRLDSVHTPLLHKPTVVIAAPEQRRIDFFRALNTLAEVSLLCLIAFAAWTLIKHIIHAWISRPATLPVPPLTYTVAIIGAGPAGISAAQHLWRSAAARSICIKTTLFESAPVIGGQLALNASDGRPVYPHHDATLDPITAEDIAGNALVWGNPLFARTSEETLGDKVEFSELSSQQVGYFAGSSSITQLTRPYSKTPTSSWLGLIWKYGASVWRAANMATTYGDPRGRIGDVPLVPDISQILISLGVIEAAQRRADEELEARGIGDPYRSDVLGPQAQRAHAQQPADLSALAVMMAAAQEDTANAYVGGALLDRLEQVVGATGANVRAATTVTRIKYARICEYESAWLVEQEAEGVSAPRTGFFDAVIIAAPNYDLYRSNSPSSDREEEEIEAASLLTYRPAHITFFTATTRLEPERYGGAEQVLFAEGPSGEEGEEALPTVRELAFVREIVRFQTDGDDNNSNNKTVEYLYRALSDDGEDVADRLRANPGITWVYQKRLENAYPSLYPSARFPSFRLSDKGLWWTSAIHSVASTVDLSWLAGKIVAEDVVKELTK